MGETEMATETDEIRTDPTEEMGMATETETDEIRTDPTEGMVMATATEAEGIRIDQIRIGIGTTKVIGNNPTTVGDITTNKEDTVANTDITTTGEKLNGKGRRNHHTAPYNLPKNVFHVPTRVID